MLFRLTDIFETNSFFIGTLQHSRGSPTLGLHFRALDKFPGAEKQLGGRPHSLKCLCGWRGHKVKFASFDKVSMGPRYPAERDEGRTDGDKERDSKRERRKERNKRGAVMQRVTEVGEEIEGGTRGLQVKPKDQHVQRQTDRKRRGSRTGKIQGRLCDKAKR